MIFSLFFPFSVFPSKSFFFIFFLFFFYFFCRGISYTSRVIQIPKILKTSFFGGKTEKGKKQIRNSRNTFVFYCKCENGIFPFFFPFSLFYLGFLQERKLQRERAKRECFLFVSHTNITKRIKEFFSTRFPSRKKSKKRSESDECFLLSTKYLLHEFYFKK